MIGPTVAQQHHYEIFAAGSNAVQGIRRGKYGCDTMKVGAEIVILVTCLSDMVCLNLMSIQGGFSCPDFPNRQVPRI